MAISRQNNSVCFEKVINMFGIDPLKFNCLVPTCLEDYDYQECEGYWTQFFESGNVTSREELAAELYNSEMEIATYLNTFPFEKYTEGEQHVIENHYRFQNNNIGLERQIFRTNWGCVKSFGTFTNELLGQAVVTYLDEDSDGLFELAQVEFDYSLVDITDIDLDKVELKFPGFYDYNNLVCPVISYTNDTENEVVTFLVDFWNLVKPELYIKRKFSKYTAIEACDLDNFVTTLDVTILKKTCKPDGYAVFNEICGDECKETKVPFCAKSIDDRKGLFRIILGSVDEEGCFISERNCPSLSPVRIEVNYLSGASNSTQMLERAVIYLAASRLPRTLCDCGCSAKMLEELKQDTSITYGNSTVKFNFPNDVRFGNPFGTKIGEIEAYKIIRQLEETLC